MAPALQDAVAAALTTPLGPLERAAAVLRAAFATDRVSLARIDSDEGRFEIVATDGAELLAPGCGMPVSACTYFLTTARGEEFVEGDFRRSRSFALPMDGVVEAAGFRSGGSAPVRAGGRTVGAISFSHRAPRRDMRAAVHDVAAVAPLLAAHLVPRDPSPAPSLSPREREVLVALEEGLRFKQIALALGVSEATAKTHGRHLFRKLDVTSRAEAVHAGRVLGLI